MCENMSWHKKAAEPIQNHSESSWSPSSGRKKRKMREKRGLGSERGWEEDRKYDLGRVHDKERRRGELATVKVARRILACILSAVFLGVNACSWV